MSSVLQFKDQKSMNRVR